jgi:Protein of unknown function (DUF2946)
MDDIVLKAIAKWPNVPDCYGWLGLDARGQWWMRDDRVQALGGFGSGATGAKGSLLSHEKLIDFIHRNYVCDKAGQWFFQNGPQRVYVELQATPYIWRVQADFSLLAHTGLAVRAQRCIVDEHGHVYMEADTGFGLVHTQDVGLAAEAVEQGLWVPQQELASELPARYGYVRSPQAQQLGKSAAP